MILASGQETICFECLKSSLLIPSGPAAQPFWSAAMAVLISSSVMGFWSGRGVPSNGCSGSSCWSVNCCWNQSLMALALPSSVPMRLPSVSWTMMGGVGFNERSCFAARNILRQSSVEVIWSARAFASSAATSFNLLDMRRMMLLRSFRRGGAIFTFAVLVDLQPKVGCMDFAIQCLCTAVPCGQSGVHR